jgi:hypothetical protein
MCYEPINNSVKDENSDLVSDYQNILNMFLRKELIFFWHCSGMTAQTGKLKSVQLKHDTWAYYFVVDIAAKSWKAQIIGH